MCAFSSEGNEARRALVMDRRNENNSKRIYEGNFGTKLPYIICWAEHEHSAESLLESSVEGDNPLDYAG